MANNVTGNPWFIDTVGFQFKYPTYIQNLTWNNAIMGSTLLITDNQGRTVASATANAAESSFNFGSLKWVQGFNVVTLSAGNLMVTIQK